MRAVEETRVGDYGSGEGAGLRVTPQKTWQDAVRVGLICGAVAVFVCAVGMVEAFAVRPIAARVATLGYLLLFSVPLVFGGMAAAPPAQREGFARARVTVTNILRGAVAGAIGAGILSVFVVLTSTFDVRQVFRNISPRLLELLTFGRGAATGVVILLVSFTVIGAVAGAYHLLTPRWRRAVVAALLWVLTVGLLQGVFAQLFRGGGLPQVNRFLYLPAGGLSVRGLVLVAALAAGLSLVLEQGKAQVRSRVAALPPAQKKGASAVAILAVAAFIWILPTLLGPFLSEVLNVAGIFLLMALGLNIVVGFAGLLDLGYVAFFAVGAYTTAVLTSPSSPRWSPELTLFGAAPFIVIAAALAGIFVATPVLRMRGDYLAIVTLGFGEIARLLFLSDWLTPYFGGAQGIIRIPNLSVGPVVFNSPQMFVYAIFVFALLAAYVSWALRDSRIGRAWMAMREDEPVAEAMGVNIVRAKLWAFVIGAVLASFGGGLFAMKIGSVFPHSFDIIVSITVLVIIIVGGMGSIPGVIVGSLVLVALPELLREFEAFKFLMYGALLIFMMLKRPEGLIPSKQRAQELHQEEIMQDAWLRGNIDQAERGPAPA